MLSAEASKLRGRLTWASCGMFGRQGETALLQRQYIDENLASALHFYHNLVQIVEPRQVLLQVSQPPKA